MMKIVFANLLLLMFCVFWAGCNESSRGHQIDSKSFTAEYMNLITQRTGIIIPTNSRGLNMYDASKQIDPAFLAKIEIPASAVDDVVKQIKELPMEQVSVTNYLSRGLSWWKPSPSSTEVERRFSYGEFRDFVDVLLCDEDGRKVLYVEWTSR